MHGKVRMLIVCHLSYQDSEAIVNMKQNATIPTELAKLGHYGIYWLTSYLENMLQYVSFGDTYSTLRNVIMRCTPGFNTWPEIV